jgi:hypothetical protein
MELRLKVTLSKAWKGLILLIKPHKQEALMLPPILTPELTQSGNQVDLVGLISEVAMTDFKGLVCFCEIAKEEDQDDTFQQWTNFTKTPDDTL